MLPLSQWALGRSSPQNGCHCLLCSDSKARASSTTREATCRLTRSFSIIPMPPETKCQSKCFPRADGSTHVCAFSGDSAAAARPGSSRTGPGCDRTSARNMRDGCHPRSGQDRIIAKQACFRPITRDYVPLIGRVPRIESAYVATGHNVWGILNAPATGEALSELILDGKAHTVDLAPFDPNRLPPSAPAVRRPS